VFTNPIVTPEPYESSSHPVILLKSHFSTIILILVIRSTRMKVVVHVARMGARRDAYTVLVRKPEGRRPLERPRSRLEDNIKVDLRKVDGGMDSDRSGSG
jgi:hypothetical protein